MSPTAGPRHPNNFRLSGDEGVEVSYDQTSQTGQPLLSYRDARRDLSRSGHDIRSEETNIGRLVTIELETVPDLHSISLSLLIPVINLDDGKAEFETLAIETTSQSGPGGPWLIPGPIDSYRAMRLRGKAQLLES
jgi:hypothetical protein